MSPRLKKLIGGPALLAGLALYVAAAVGLAAHALPENWLAQLVYYAGAGVAWAFPARYLVLWMNRSGAP